MKKYLKSVLIALVLLPALLVFSACGKKQEEDTRTELASSHIVLEYESYEYNGEAVEPNVSVVVGTKTIGTDNYTVEYTDNNQVGKATVKVTAKDSSKEIKGSASTTFEIVEHIAKVADYDELINAIRNSEQQIRLTQNIAKQTIENRNQVYIFAGSSSSNAIPKNLDFELDLDGYIIENPIYIDNCSDGGDFTVSVKIKNGTVLVTGEQGEETPNYAILVSGNADLNVVLEKLTVQAPDCAILTDKDYSGATLTANECEFSATGENIAVGTSLSADYNYNFNSSTFNGKTAYSFEAGTHTLNDCKFYADGDTSVAPENNTSSAIVLFTETSEEAVETTITIVINGGIIESQKGYAFEEKRTGEGEYAPTISITLNSVSITCKDGTSEDTAFHLTAGLAANGCTFNTYTPPEIEPPVSGEEGED